MAKDPEDIAAKIAHDELKDQIHQASRGNAILLASYRELRRLPIYLQEGEEVVSIVSGTPTNYKFLRLRRGIVVATDRRVIFVHDGWVFRTVQDFPYTSINSIEFTTRIFFGDLMVFGFGDQVVYKWVGRIAGSRFSKIVRQMIVNATNDEGRNHLGLKPNEPKQGFSTTNTHFSPDLHQQYDAPLGDNGYVQTNGDNGNFGNMGVPASDSPIHQALPFQPTMISQNQNVAPVSSITQQIPVIAQEPQPIPVIPQVSADTVSTDTKPLQTNEDFDRTSNQLQKLGELKDKGLITQEEYDEKRKFYIDRL